MLQVVWLKRDLRLKDHAPLMDAIQSGFPTVLLFLAEPILLEHPKYSNRHWKFMLESIVDMNRDLTPFHTHVHTLEVNALTFFEELQEQIGAFRLLSHQETGVGSTFVRDLQVKKFCKQHAIEWKEYKQHGVLRGSEYHGNWSEKWDKLMHTKVATPQLKNMVIGSIPASISENYKLKYELQPESDKMQEGGRTHAVTILKSFLNGRYKRYSKHISKPRESRVSCSRLSPHLAWGTITVREIVQSLHKKASQLPSGYTRDLENYKSRLYWHCHFIQKLELRPSMEFDNHNKAFDTIRTEVNQNLLNRFTKGETGIPLVDATMRCLNETGYINFRMRAMLVSLWTHHLLQPWQAIAPHLANIFLDFEPGIHYPQLQMQAGTTGNITIRTYNPTKQALDHDPEAIFIKHWVPELKNLLPKQAIEPWKITPMEAMMDNFDLEKDYFLPICDIEKDGRIARDLIHSLK